MVSKEERVEQFLTIFFLSSSPSSLPVDEEGETEEERKGICYSRTDVVVISIGRCLQNFKV